MSKVILAKSAGFCFGVNRAVERIYKLIHSGEKNICTFGELIHNPFGIDDLKKNGVVTFESLAEIKKDNTVPPKKYLVVKDNVLSSLGLCFGLQHASLTQSLRKKMLLEPNQPELEQNQPEF